MANVKDMTKGSYVKNIILFAIPLFFSNLFQQLYNSIDAIIVGNFLGTNSLAAVSSSGNLIFLFTSFFIGTASGISVLISKYFGEKDYESMRKVIHTGIAFGLICGVILTILGVAFTPFMLKIMKTDVNVLPESIKYFRYYFLGVSGIVMYNIFNGILNALGNSKRSLYYLIFSSISLNMFFITSAILYASSISPFFNCSIDLLSTCTTSILLNLLTFEIIIVIELVPISTVTIVPPILSILFPPYFYAISIYYIL